MLSDRKDVIKYFFDNIKKSIEEGHVIMNINRSSEIKYFFDTNIWKIGYKKDKLNYKLNKIKKS